MSRSPRRKSIAASPLSAREVGSRLSSVGGENAGRAAIASPPSARTGLTRIVDATGYSLSGLQAAVRSETAFRQEACVAAVLLPLAFWIGQSRVDTALLVGSVFLVLIVELLNSAIEAAVDRVSLDRHELSKRAKDLASAAVFLALLLCAGLWISALWNCAEARVHT